MGSLFFQNMKLALFALKLFHYVPYTARADGGRPPREGATKVKEQVPQKMNLSIWIQLVETRKNLYGDPWSNKMFPVIKSEIKAGKLKNFA